MSSVYLPDRISRPKRQLAARSCSGHRAWVRRHHCCVADCESTEIECAHVRRSRDGGMALKPADRWAISLCAHHHQEQHRIGERAFEAKYDLDLMALALVFSRRSPHRKRLIEM